MVLWLNMGKTCPLGAQAGPWAFQRCVVFTQFLKPGRGMTSQKNQRHTSVPGLMRTIQSRESWSPLWQRGCWGPLRGSKGYAPSSEAPVGFPKAWKGSALPPHANSITTIQGLDTSYSPSQLETVLNPDTFSPSAAQIFLWAQLLRSQSLGPTRIKQ